MIASFLLRLLLMKHVYVLISNENDYYYEQCLVSVTSLKYQMPNAEVIILTDKNTENTFIGKRRGLLELDVNIISVEFPKNLNNRVRSRMLKTSMFDYIDDDFLYIDIDTIVSDDLTDIEILDKKLAFVLDKHVRIEKHYLKKQIFANADKMHYHSSFNGCHWNGGVCLVRNTQENCEFFKLWNALYKECLNEGIEIDQIALNEANNRMNGVIEELPGIWNVQLCCGMQYLSEGKILHYLGYQPLDKHNIYFNTLPYILCDGDYLREIKAQGAITENVQNIIENPKRAFKNVHIIPDDCVMYSLMFSNHVRILKFLYVKFHSAYNVLELFYGFLFKKIFKRI